MQIRTSVILILLLIVSCKSNDSRAKKIRLNDCPNQIEILSINFSNCDHNSNPYRLKNRIISINVIGDTTELILGYAENCCSGDYPCISFKDGTLKIVLDNRVDEDLELCDCICCYEATIRLSGIPDRDFKTYLNGFLIKQSDEKYKTYDVTYQLDGNDTVNMTNKYGFKVGIWRDYYPNGLIKSESFYGEELDQFDEFKLSTKEYDSIGKLLKHSYYDISKYDSSFGSLYFSLDTLDYVEKVY
jgi:hypothetical protein